MTGQDGSPVSVDVLQLLSAFRVPHLRSTGGSLHSLFDTASQSAGSQFHLDGTVERPGQQSGVIGRWGEQSEASDLLFVTLKDFTFTRRQIPHLKTATEADIYRTELPVE